MRPKGFGNVKHHSAENREIPRGEPCRIITVAYRISLPAPVGHKVVARVSQLMLLGAIGRASSRSRRVRPDWRSNTMCRPSGDQEGKSLVPASWVSCSQRMLAMSITVDVLPARSARTVLAIPAKGQKLAAWETTKARWRSRESVMSLNIRAILVHDVDLRQPGAPAHPRNLRVGARVPRRRNIRSAERRQRCADCCRPHSPPISRDRPDREEEKAILVPSPDHAGDWLAPSCRCPQGSSQGGQAPANTCGPSQPFAAQRCKCQPGIIRRNARRDRNASQVSDGVLISGRRNPSPKSLLFRYANSQSKSWSLRCRPHPRPGEE
jgi:hypothetical protein